MRKVYIYYLMIGCGFLLNLLSSCKTNSTPISIQLPAPSSPTSVSVPLPSAIPTQTLPVLPGTPVPLPNESITPNNINQIRELAIWGKGHIEKIMLSPNGKILAVGTLAGVWLYDAETFAELGFINTGNFIGDMAFTADSQRVIIDVGATTLTVWDDATTEKLGSKKVRDKYLGSVGTSPGSSALSPSGKFFAASIDDSSVILWNTDTGEKTHRLEIELQSFSDRIDNLVFSQDQSLLVVTTTDSDAIQLWDVYSGKLLRVLEVGQFYSTALSQEQNNPLLATAGEGGITLWETKSGNLMQSLEDPTGRAWGVAFSNDGALLVSGSAEKEAEPDTKPVQMARIWRVFDGELLQTIPLTKHTNTVNQFMFSPDNKRLLTSSADGSVRRWDIETSQFIDMLGGFERNDSMIVRTPPYPAFLTSDQIFISNPFNFSIELWDLNASRILKTLNGHTSNVTDPVISTDGSTLASCELWDYRVWIWDTQTGQSINAYDAFIDVGYGKYLAISPDGNLIATGDGRDGARVYKAKTGDDRYPVKKLDRGMRGLAFSPDGSTLASASGENTLAILDAKTGDVFRELKTGPFTIGMTFSPDSKLIAVGTREGVIELWDVITGNLIDSLQQDNRQILSLAFSPNGNILAAGVRDLRMPDGSLSPTIQLWDMQTHSPLGVINEYMANIDNLSFSPDGRLLASSSSDGTMRLWGILPE